MAYYLVTAQLHQELKTELIEKLEEKAFLLLQPFGREIMKALTEARLLDDGTVTWEEEDYCTPPLKAEKEAVLDRYFSNIEVEKVDWRGDGWKRIFKLPRLFPEVGEYIDPEE